LFCDRKVKISTAPTKSESWISAERALTSLVTPLHGSAPIRSFINSIQQRHLANEGLVKRTRATQSELIIGAS